MGHPTFGSKATAGLCQAIIAMMPPHNVYVESHLGTGAIMKRKPPAMRNIGIDRDWRSIEGFRADHPVELVHGCCHRFLSTFEADENTLVYADPPYLASTRKAPDRYRYRYDYEEQDHRELIGILRSWPGPVMLSGYPSRLYDECLGDWHSLSMQVMNHAGVVTEKVWYNFEPGRLHWHRLAGRNSTDRQRIKRRAETWSRRYREMGSAERLAVLSGIMGVEAGEHEASG